MTTTSEYTKLSLFEAAVLYHPTTAERKAAQTSDGSRTQLVVEVQPFLARDNEHAAMLAARAIPDEYADRLDRCEVVVRPF